MVGYDTERSGKRVVRHRYRTLRTEIEELKKAVYFLSSGKVANTREEES